MIKHCLVILFTVAGTLAAGTAVRSNNDSPRGIALRHADQDHAEWIARSLEEMQTIKVGSTRSDLLEVFTTEGGLSTRVWRTYVYRGCQNIKVDVEFEPIGPPARDDARRILPTESADDLITKISRPYLAGQISD